jgi:DNA-directed RNA polymerase specialized sigma24 family protein
VPQAGTGWCQGHGSRERSTRRRAFQAGKQAPCPRGGAGAVGFAVARRQEKAQAHRATLLSGTDFLEGLLYQESVCQALLGERRCPREVSFVAFLSQSMRSIASHRRKELARQVPITNEGSSGNSIGLSIAADQFDPEESLIEREAADVVVEIYKLLDGDDEAQLTIMAIIDGKKGKELRDELGIDQARFDYIMKRIRRAVAKKYPKGWPS